MALCRGWFQPQGFDAGNCWGEKGRGLIAYGVIGGGHRDEEMVVRGWAGLLVSSLVF